MYGEMEAVMTYFEVLCQHSPGIAKVNQKNFSVLTCNPAETQIGFNFEYD
jgi:hypothetical protein